MIKAIFFDVDGTLVGFRQTQLSDQLRADLLALQAKGIKIFICSGRARQDFDSTGMLRGVKFDGYITLNGQCCFDQDGIYRDMPICREDLTAACRVLRDNPHVAALIEENGVSYLTKIDDRVRDIFRFLHTELFDVRPPELMLEENVYQFVPLVGPEEEDLFLSVMPHCVHTRWHPQGLDILPEGGGKTAGIRAAMERYGLTADEIMAFGDGENDMAMLELAGIGVAMGNSEERVKVLANYVTASVDEDGISQALRHFGLLPSAN
ncbi:MAG: Cof-type HAD-IIB family hydrolase [Oscillospiraceae bacterium]|nr:Cof-type HAD-IIB family hydrolase [Oscillospiraceae bacterium]